MSSVAPGSPGPDWRFLVIRWHTGRGEPESVGAGEKQIRLLPAEEAFLPYRTVTEGCPAWSI
jgi:hypothetical protein